MASDETYYSNNTYGTWTHIVNNGLMMQVHGGDQQVRLVRRPDSVEHGAVLQHAVRRAGVPVPDAQPGRPAELSELHMAGQLPGAPGRELAQGQARDEVRRRGAEGSRHESVGPEPPRHICVPNAAVDGDSERGVPAGLVEQPVARGRSTPCCRSCRSSTSSTTRTSSSTCRARTTRRGSATTGARPRT